MQPWQPDAVLAAFASPPGYRLEHARAADVPELIARLREWYPDIVVGAESVHLDPAFYARDVYLAHGDAERPVLALVARPTASTEMVAALTLSRDPHARTVSGRLGAVAPAHRASALGLLGPRLLEAFGRASGAELATYFATLKSRHQQVIAERLGFEPVGIVPGNDRDMVAPGEVRRVYEILYAKVLVEPAQVLTPAPEHLTAKTRALYMHLFGA
ncbi:hypothetical protein EON77_10880 [bacterium]|nr:MAG: hypothetical protein EON77_10880 [bacterium]